MVLKFAEVGTPGRGTPRTPRTPRGSATPRGARSGASARTHESRKKRKSAGGGGGGPLGLVAGLLGGAGRAGRAVVGLALGLGGDRKRRGEKDRAADSTAESKRPGAPGVPPQLAVPLAGAALGALGLLLARARPVYYEIQEGDTLCGIAGCYNVNYLDVFDRNLDTIGKNPDVIFPGDRLRIR